MVATRACERSPSECASLLVGAQLQMLCAGQKGGITVDEMKFGNGVKVYKYVAIPCNSHKDRPGKSAPSDFSEIGNDVMFSAEYVSPGGHKILRIYESTASTDD